jgi:SAM-dependent methyltransferase
LPNTPQGSILGSRRTITQAGLAPARTCGLARPHYDQGRDVYVSPYTRLVADGHHLPFRDAVFDGVWIQAVLEHVLEPQRVVDEVYRVLKPGSLVYDSVPFIQQVHEKAYDFTRFTMNGHRWLFRRFEQIDAGSVGGAGTAAIWSLRYLWRALGIGDKGSMLLTLPFFWLHCLDRITQRKPNTDAASGTYFFGIKSNESLNCKDMVAYYESQ